MILDIDPIKKCLSNPASSLVRVFIKLSNPFNAAKYNKN